MPSVGLINVAALFSRQEFRNKEPRAIGQLSTLISF